jgi:hypothetical protein
VDNLTRFLLDFFLFRNFAKFASAQAEKVQQWLKTVKAFSWEATLLLSLFSWFVMLLLEGIYVRKFVSIFAWGFLIIGLDWALLGKDYKGKTIQIPLIDYKLKYGPWLTGMVATMAFFTNDFIIRDWQGALISWPIFSAVLASWNRFVKAGLKIELPKSEDRQDIVLLFLISGLLSSWFQFHFVIQDVLQRYPSLRSEDFSRSVFVTRIGAAPPAMPKGYEILDAAETVVRETLNGKSWIEAQRWLNELTNGEDRTTTQTNLREQMIRRVYGEELPRESAFWQILPETVFQSSQVDLLLRAIWRGPTSQPDRSVFRRLCTIREVVNPNPQSFEDLQQGSSFDLQCQPSRMEVLG